MTAGRFYPIPAHILVLSISIFASFVDCGETLLKLDRSHQTDRPVQRSSKRPRMEANDDIELHGTTHKVLSAMGTQPRSFLHLPHFFPCRPPHSLRTMLTSASVTASAESVPYRRVSHSVEKTCGPSKRCGFRCGRFQGIRRVVGAQRTKSYCLPLRTLGL